MKIKTNIIYRAIAVFALACPVLPLAAQEGDYCRLACDGVMGNNTLFGYLALDYEPRPYNNTAIGHRALTGHRTGPNNTAIGYNALANNITGSSNIALGKGAGAFLTNGSNNIDIGNAG